MLLLANSSQHWHTPCEMRNHSQWHITFLNSNSWNKMRVTLCVTTTLVRVNSTTLKGNHTLNERDIYIYIYACNCDYSWTLTKSVILLACREKDIYTSVVMKQKSFQTLVIISCHWTFAGLKVNEKHWCSTDVPMSSTSVVCVCVCSYQQQCSCCFTHQLLIIWELLMILCKHS